MEEVEEGGKEKEEGSARAEVKQEAKSETTTHQTMMTQESMYS